MPRKDYRMYVSSVSNNQQNFKAMVKLETGIMRKQGETFPKEFKNICINSDLIQVIRSTDGVFKDDNGNNISSTTIKYNSDPSSLHFEKDGSISVVGSNECIIYDIPKKYEEVMQYLK